jgi:hypothetical protein
MRPVPHTRGRSRRRRWPGERAAAGRAGEDIELAIAGAAPLAATWCVVADPAGDVLPLRVRAARRAVARARFRSVGTERRTWLMAHVKSFADRAAAIKASEAAVAAATKRGFALTVSASSPRAPRT